jgi:hypothetical protein
MRSKTQIPQMTAAKELGNDSCKNSLATTTWIGELVSHLPLIGEIGVICGFKFGI